MSELLRRDSARHLPRPPEIVRAAPPKRGQRNPRPFLTDAERLWALADLKAERAALDASGRQMETEAAAGPPAVRSHSERSPHRASAMVGCCVADTERRTAQLNGSR
jgi:hypothetical protein